ncbi:glucose-6-phosphate isomerase [Mycoplasmopsis pullorum]|uniref:glucose-6-phosphate isomerase n=1 Tax=Mycoplasmopsis pullorum TaxID=48003 RepID=UPI00111B0A06|nr:glucose-6-phosphate isomerase [Mycoplasmopsis pullorum]TNK83056.1 glucose-6-phosphate isomerase [Mycoplasmopsis pullorum]TNK91764.1 glucose-6-phosphate isomerase [Mycoplasmopsis pullorum]
MKYLKLDLENALKNPEEIQLLKSRVEKIHHDVLNKNVEEKDWLGWYDLPNTYDREEVRRMKQISQKWAENGVEVVVVIGIGGSYLGAKTGYEFIYGEYPIKKPLMELVFAGNDISAEALASKLHYVNDKKFAINVISKSGTTLEPSIAFREFRLALEAQIGREEAAKYIVATTDAKKGVLFELSKERGYERFIVPDDIGGRFSVMSAVGLFPFYCAGIDGERILEGARITNEELSSEHLSQNPAYQYATTRYLLHEKYKYPVEMMVSYEPKLQYFSEWWKQLFAESEGKDGKGIWPASGIFSTDLHSLGQMIQDGSKILFETVLTVEQPQNNIKFNIDANEDIDKLSYLNGNNLHNVNNIAFKATQKAHVEVGQVPNIHITFKDFSPETLGALFMFFERALTMSAYLLGVNPFNQPGVEIYKKNMFTMLGKK